MAQKSRDARQHVNHRVSGDFGPCGIECFVNWKGLGRRRSWPDLKAVFCLEFPGVIVGSYGEACRIVGLPVDMQSGEPR